MNKKSFFFFTVEKGCVCFFLSLAFLRISHSPGHGVRVRARRLSDEGRENSYRRFSCATGLLLRRRTGFVRYYTEARTTECTKVEKKMIIIISRRWKKKNTSSEDCGGCGGGRVMLPEPTCSH